MTSQQCLVALTAVGNCSMTAMLTLVMGTSQQCPITLIGVVN